MEIFQKLGSKLCLAISFLEHILTCLGRLPSSTTFKLLKLVSSGHYEETYINIHDQEKSNHKDNEERKSLHSQNNRSPLAILNKSWNIPEELYSVLNRIRNIRFKIFFYSAIPIIIVPERPVHLEKLWSRVFDSRLIKTCRYSSAEMRFQMTEVYIVWDLGHGVEPVDVVFIDIMTVHIHQIFQNVGPVVTIEQPIEHFHILKKQPNSI